MSAPMRCIASWVGLLTIAQHAASTSIEVASGGFLNEKTAPVGMDAFSPTLYGKSKCPCVGINKLSGYYASNLDYYHIQYPMSAGAFCAAHDLTTHPLCKDGDGPDWCSQRWCYVDPCNCETESIPGLTQTNVEFQGGPAYWSYETCGFLDLYSEEMSKTTACVSQKNASACGKYPDKCAWDGKRCGGKEVVEGCGKIAKTYDTKYGQEDCRCVGLSGKDIGRAYLNINDKDRIPYPADVGSFCHAWEAEAHPECEGVPDADKPAFCHTQWCFVDPCKCKTSAPARIVMPANQNLQYQGKTAYWSSQTCGFEDLWTQSHSAEYCVTQSSQQECAKLKDRCAWTGTACVGKALAGICQEQEQTGVMGFESSLSSTFMATPKLAALLINLPVLFLL